MKLLPENFLLRYLIVLLFGLLVGVAIMVFIQGSFWVLEIVTPLLGNTYGALAYIVLLVAIFAIPITVYLKEVT